MNKTDTASAAQNDTFNFTPLFGSDELKLETTPKAVTPFAGMASFFVWLGALEFQKRVAARSVRVHIVEYRLKGGNGEIFRCRRRSKTRQLLRG